MSAPPPIEAGRDFPPVLLIADLARLLRCSRRTIDRLRAAGRFPFPELPVLDDRPRWARDTVLSRLNAGAWSVRRTA